MTIDTGYGVGSIEHSAVQKVSDQHLKGFQGVYRSLQHVMGEVVSTEERTFGAKAFNRWHPSA